MRHTRTYNAWAYIRRVSEEGQRWVREQPAQYHDPMWFDFKIFLEDMGECPEGHRLFRRDHDRGYDPGNCYWGEIPKRE
jgi:hypothetical protein